MTAVPFSRDLAAADVPLSKILLLLENEIVDLAIIADRVGEAAGGLLRNGGTSSDVSILEIQHLDALAQHLRGLATFVQALAPAIPHGLSIDPGPAASILTLSGLARRLGGEMASADERSDFGSGVPGDCEMF